MARVSPALPNPRLRRTRMRAPLSLKPLGGATSRWPLDDPGELAPRGSGGYQGAQQQIKSDGGIRGLHLRHARLTGADELGKPRLGQVSGLSPQSQALGQREPELDELGFLFGQSQQLAGRANLPACGLEFLSFRSFHHSSHAFVVMPESPSAVVKNGPGRGGRFLVEDLHNQNGVRVDPVQDSPCMVAIPNPKLVAADPQSLAWCESAEDSVAHPAGASAGDIRLRLVQRRRTEES